MAKKECLHSGTQKNVSPPGENEIIAEKPRLLTLLQRGGFNVPPFVHLTAEDFRNENFSELKRYFGESHDTFKVIARSAHPQEHFFKGGTFDSLETYADVAGIVYARKKIITTAKTAKRLTIARQQRFNNAPEIDIDEMGIIVMPFIEGTSVMAKVIEGYWEFGYADQACRIGFEPYLTRTPHDRKLLDISSEIEAFLGFKCEIEYILSDDGEIHVVQGKDISHIEIPLERKRQFAVRLDGIRRVRKRRNFRERPIFVMDNREFYIDVISRCEEVFFGEVAPAPTAADVVAVIRDYEQAMEDFALRHERFGVLGLCVRPPEDLYQSANHYLDDFPEMQREISQSLRDNQYKIDYFISEADTLIARNRIHFNICTHDAYGIDTLRNPLWSVYWKEERHDDIVRRLRQAGFKTGDTVAIEIDAQERPSIFRV